MPSGGKPAGSAYGLHGTGSRGGSSGPYADRNGAGRIRYVNGT